MPTDSTFNYDVFLSHSAKNKDVVREVANRLKSDGVRVWLDEWEIRPGDSIPAKIEDGLENSRVLLLCLSAEAFGSDWAQLESHTFRFKDPLNHNRRFIPLRLDDTPAKGSLAQFSYIDWRQDRREEEYAKLLEACRDTTHLTQGEDPDLAEMNACKIVEFNDTSPYQYVFSPDGKCALMASTGGYAVLCDMESQKQIKVFKGHSSSVNCVSWASDRSRALTGSDDRTVRLWDVHTGRCERVLEGHPGSVYAVAWSTDDRRALSAAFDSTVRLWNVDSGACLRVFDGHTADVNCVSWSPDECYALSGADDETLRLWDLQTGRCVRMFEGHTGWVRTVAWTANQSHALSGADDTTLRLWDVQTGRCLRVLEGHTGIVQSVAWSNIDQRLALSGSWDKTVRLWDVTSGRCLRALEGHEGAVMTVAWSTDGRHAYSGDMAGGIRIWNLSEFVTESETQTPLPTRTLPTTSHVQYTNAKVLLVGNSAAGKTGLSNRLAQDTYKETDSTVGAWATQWKLSLPEGDNVAGDSSRSSDEDDLRQDATTANVEREVWLWDFGGQADQRLIHQLYMDQTQVAALVFDPQKDDCLETLSQWDRDLSRADKDKPDRDRMTKLLVAGRCDAGGLRVARRQIDDFVAERGYATYLETSAKTRAGCTELKQAIIDGIQWENIPWRSSPPLFKRLKDEIIRLKDEGRVLMRFNELREVLALRKSGRDEDGDGGRFTDAELKAVIGLLAGPGVVWELEFGSWVLLQPERINAYAQAVIKTIREDKYDRGCIPEECVLKGDLNFEGIDRLAADEERFVLLAMHQVLVERGLCIRHQTETGAILLIFPSYYRRERPEAVSERSVQVSYQFAGFLDEIYATLVVKLHHTKEFDHDHLWRYGADFRTRDGKQGLGIRLKRLGEGKGELEVYFAEDVTVGEKILFSKYIHEHLMRGASDVVRLRHYVCFNQYRGAPCDTTANREVAMERLEEHGQHATINCQRCDETLELWDELERQFGDPEVQQRVRDLAEQSKIKLDNESKERVLVGEVISTVALAGQICRELSVSDHGIDMEIEFKDDNGHATSKRVYLQLKSGDAYLAFRKRDNAEIFKSFNQRQAEYWMTHESPVILIIRNSKGEIRWMDIRDHLRDVTNNGQKQVRQIQFGGNRFDVMSVRGWRDSALGSVGG